MSKPRDLDKAVFLVLICLSFVTPSIPIIIIIHLGHYGMNRMR